jgi:hypothetical protein
MLAHEAMCPRLIVFAVSALLVSAASQSGGHQTYYVDSSTGDDGNNGLSPAKAWKSLDKVNRASFQPGDCSASS